MLLLKRGDDILRDEVGAGGGCDGVLERGLEVGGVCFDDFEGLVGRRRGDRVKGGDEGVDGCDLLGEVGLGG